MTKIDCLDLCEKMRSEFDLTERACLHIIQIGDNPVNDLYINSKIREAEKWNVNVVVDRFDGKNLSLILRWIDHLNRKYSVDGIIIQLPTGLSTENEKILCDYITSEKDVDGLQRFSKFTPCTPEGIMYLLNSIGYEGKTIGIIGRGKLVGKPLADMLKDKPCTLILMNSSTSDLTRHNLLTACDIVVSCVGQPKLFSVLDIKYNCVVIDAGISRVDGKQIGDFSHEWLDTHGQYVRYTPWTNGVGKLTVASLMAHVREAYERRTK